MSKVLLAFLTILLSINLMICPLVLAGNLNVQASGNRVNSLTGDAPVRRIGKIKLPAGVAVVKDNHIDVLFDDVDLTEKTAIAEKKKSLTGTCFGMITGVRHGHPCVTGFTYMDGGSSFAQIDQPGAADSVSLTDGTIRHGKITSVTSEQVTVTTADGERQLDIISIKDVVSPRVFIVSFPYDHDGQTSEARFTPTYTAARWVGGDDYDGFLFLKKPPCVWKLRSVTYDAATNRVMPAEGTARAALEKTAQGLLGTSPKIPSAKDLVAPVPAVAFPVDVWLTFVCVEPDGTIKHASVERVPLIDLRGRWNPKGPVWGGANEVQKRLNSVADTLKGMLGI